ncbi:hypothetical protein V8C86DRAFT_2443534 [Haematococcus lacustris]
MSHHTQLLDLPSAVLALIARTKISRFLSPAVLAVLRARKQPLQLQLLWNEPGPSHNIPDMLRFVIGLLRGCTAVHEVVLDGRGFGNGELGAWLGATLADSFPNLDSLTLAFGMSYEALARLLSDPALKAQLRHVDISQAFLHSPGKAAFYREAVSLHSLQMEHLDSPGESLHDLPCQWRTLRVGKADIDHLSKLPLHAVREVVHIDRLRVVARADDLAEITAGASCFAVGVPVRPKVDILRVDIVDTSDEELAVLAALQPLAGCIRVVDVVCGDWNDEDDIQEFDADVMEALLPVCQGCSELRIRLASLQPSPQMWHAIVDRVPSIAKVHIHQCYELDEDVLLFMEEYVAEHGGRDIDIQIDYFLTSPMGAQEDLGDCDLSDYQFGPLRAGTEVFLQPVQAWNFPMNMRGKVFQQPTYKAYPGKVFKQGQEAPCRNEALAAGLTVYQLPQNVLPGLEVVMAIIYITRVYCSLIFSSVRPQQTPQQRTEYITQYGTGQRLQVLLAKSPSGKLDLTFKTLNNADTKAINDQLTDEQKAEVQKHKAVLTKYFTRLLPVLVKLLDRPINALATIINDPVNKRKMVGEGEEQEMLIEPAQHAAPPQAPHTDFKPVASGLDDGFVFLLACLDFDLVAYMYSHLLMEQAAPYYKNGNPDLHSLTAIATHALLREGTLVQVKAGQLVLFRGNTVHAGTAGRPDSCGARLYGFGKTGQPADNTTVNMSQLGPVFEGLFQPTQGGTITAQTGEWNRRGQAGKMVPDTEPYEPSDGI